MDDADGMAGRPQKPKLIKRTEDGVLIEWQDGHRATYPFGYLRRNCPCAGCRNSAPQVVEANDPLKLFDDQPISLETAELVGNYAVRFVWNDQHSHGIYSFDYLRAICPCPHCRQSEIGG